ncbi:Ribosomal L18p/L5e family protein [Rhynchospora pubera]|uniref:Ribosomal L18p/L5e family protein n=1 Tax=Rhynchospora pubera TaxID=906938 RepID=A0AAV8FZG8_9POAL|nr:Ribosomal L18p/L5e family protein [Rhynchospora pubera]
MDRASRHLLRLVVSCRKLSAEVSSPHSQTIIAMATSTEPEFALKQRALLARNPSSKLLWTPRTAVRVGEILANRLLGLGIDGVTVDLDEELAGRLTGGDLSRLSSSLFSALESELMVLRSSDQWPQCCYSD